jgi:hypothetical protein
MNESSEGILRGTVAEGLVLVMVAFGDLVGIANLTYVRFEPNLVCSGIDRSNSGAGPEVTRAPTTIHGWRDFLFPPGFM